MFMYNPETLPPDIDIDLNGPALLDDEKKVVYRLLESQFSGTPLDGLFGEDPHDVLQSNCDDSLRSDYGCLCWKFDDVDGLTVFVKFDNEEERYSLCFSPGYTDWIEYFDRWGWSGTDSLDVYEFASLFYGLSCEPPEADEPEDDEETGKFAVWSCSRGHYLEAFPDDMPEDKRWDGEGWKTFPAYTAARKFLDSQVNDRCIIVNLDF